ncbi:TonB-dependent siderophore receptor [Thiopseudomonas sp. 4R-3cl]|nr:TonB-dependent siderophore receptor [Thiopseudomonas sp. 4R-3cl]
MKKSEHKSRATSTNYVGRKVIGPFSLALVLAAPGADAQGLGDPGKGEVPEAVTLPAVTVTGETSSETTEGSNSYTTPRTSAATRLPLAIRDTPQAVTVITRQHMEDQQLNTIQDALAQSTGVGSRTLGSEQVTFHARGFSIDSFQYDGIPTSFGIPTGFVNGASFLDTAFYDRIEIVRGATGLLTGAGNPSASINLVRKRPTREFQANASVSAGSWDNYRSMLDVSTPMTEDGRVRARIVGVTQDRHSYQDRYQQKKNAFFGLVEVDLTPDTVLSMGYDYQDIKPKGVTWGGVPLWFSDGSNTNWSRSKSMAPDWARWDNRLENAFIGIEHGFENGWKLNATITNQRSKSNARLLSPLGYPDRNTGLGMIPLATSYSTPSRQNSFDAMVSGPFELLGRKHELVLGVLASRRTEDEYNSGFVFPSMPMPSIFGYDGQYPEPNFAANGFTSTHTTIEQSGIYGAVRLSLTDSMKAILGGRFNNYKLDEFDGSTPTHYKKTAKFTPYAGVVYDINDTYSAYASYTEIFNPQSYYRNVNNQVLPPTNGKNTEVGLKGEYLDGRLNASIALFETRLDNLAQAENYALPNGTLAYHTVNGAKSRGVEFDLQGELADDWNIYGGVAHFNSTDATGERLSAYLPRTTARLFTTYRLPGDWSKLTVGGGVTWQSGTYQSATNPQGASVNVEQKSYALASLMAKYRATRNIDLMLTVNNLTDRRYTLMSGFYNQVVYGAPRNIVLTLNYKL